MKKLFKQSLAVLLSATLLLTAAPLVSSAAEMAPQEESVGALTLSGKTGDCTWTFDDDGTLTISGNGAMKDYTEYNPYLCDTSPWGLWIGIIVKKVVIGDGVTHIGDWAFEECTCLTSVTIPDSVTSIGDYAFDGCTGLTSITIPDSVRAIGDFAFRNCTGLTSITIPDSVTSVGRDVFYGCTGLESAESGKTGDCTWTLDNTGTLTISGNGAMKDYIAYNPFAYNPNYLSDSSPWGPWTGLSVKKVVIGDGVTHIGDYAFLDCIRLTSVSIPHSVTSIGYDAFRDCTGLTSVSIPNSVTTIDSGAFHGCTGLTSVTIPHSVTSIGGSAFEGCTGLTSVTIPDSVTSIGSDAFDGTAWYNNQPDGMVYAGRVAYKYKGTMPDNTSIIIRDGTKGIAGSAFEGCTGLTSVSIPDSVTSIGDDAFRGCTGLTSVSIPDSVTSIGDYAFKGCTGLTSVTIPDSVTSIGWSAFEDCTGLTSVTIPDSVTSIDWSAFRDCTGLTSVTIPDSVTTIDKGAFYGCTGLTSVIIPDSVTSIGNKAFGYADSSKKIDGFTIYGVPGSAAEQYANDNGFDFIAVNLLECPNCHAALVIDAAVPPTYTATGLTEGLHCSVCGEVIMAQGILPKKPIDFTYGDSSGDDVVNVTDVTDVQRYLANLKTMTEQELGAADVNADGKVTIDDVTLLQRYLAEFDVTIG